MKVLVKNIKWDYDFNKDEDLVKRFEKERQKEYDAYMEDYIEGDAPFEEVFDEESVKAELLATKKGLPAEAYMIEYSDEETKLYEQREKTSKNSKQYKELSEKIKNLPLPSEDKIREFLNADKSVKVVSFEAQKANKDTELTKIMMKDGINELFSKGDFQKYLDLTANFTKYSINNRMLVYKQKPEAELVKGKMQWKEFGRYLNKGAEAIWINTPITKQFVLQKNAPQNVVNDVINGLRQFIADQNQRVLTQGTDFGFITPEKQVEIENDLLRKGKVDVFTGYTSVAKVYDVSDTYGKELPEIEKKEPAVPSELMMALRLAYPSINFPYLKEYTSDKQKSDYFNLNIERVSEVYLHSADIRVPGVNGDNKNYSLEEMKAENSAIAYLVNKHFGIDTNEVGNAFMCLRDNYDTTEEQFKVMKALSHRIEKTVEMIVDSIEENLKYTKGNINITNMSVKFDRTYFENMANGIPMAEYQDGTKPVATVKFIMEADKGMVFELYHSDKPNVMDIKQYEDNGLTGNRDNLISENEVFSNTIDTAENFISTVLDYIYVDKELENTDKTNENEEDEIDR